MIVNNIGVCFLIVSTEMDAEDDGREDGVKEPEDEAKVAIDSEPNSEMDSNGMVGASLECNPESESRETNHKSGNSEKTDEEVGGKRKAEDGEHVLFQLTVVNSYGSQEVQKLEGSKKYKFTS